MIPVKFYESLDYDFSYLNGEDNLNGLTLGGFNGGNKPLNINNFDIIELKAARDLVACHLEMVQCINKRISSFGLKHLLEKVLADRTNRKLNYISNGTLILAMVDAGYRFTKDPHDSPNCFFNVSQKSINKLIKEVERTCY